MVKPLTFALHNPEPGRTFRGLLVGFRIQDDLGAQLIETRDEPAEVVYDPTRVVRRGWLEFDSQDSTAIAFVRFLSELEMPPGDKPHPYATPFSLAEIVDGRVMEVYEGVRLYRDEDSLLRCAFTFDWRRRGLPEDSWYAATVEGGQMNEPDKSKSVGATLGAPLAALALAFSPPSYELPDWFPEKVGELILQAERLFDGPGRGLERRRWVIEQAQMLLRRHNFKKIPDWIEMPVKDLLVEVVVDALFSFMRSQGWIGRRGGLQHATASLAPLSTSASISELG